MYREIEKLCIVKTKNLQYDIFNRHLFIMGQVMKTGYCGACPGVRLPVKRGSKYWTVNPSTGK